MSAGGSIRTGLQVPLRRLRSLQNRAPCMKAAAVFHSTLASGSLLSGAAGRRYRILRPLGNAKAQDVSRVWLAVNDANEVEEYVVKEPDADDKDCGWPLFQHEHDMQVLFRDSKFIRQMVDYVPSSARGTPMLVLEAFERTLWQARVQRPMSSKEIKWIMKAVVLALWEVHRKGLVYSGTVIHTLSS